jgi:hypothetical protein
MMYMSPAPAAPAEGPPPERCRYAWAANVLIYVAALVTLLSGVMPGWFY